MRALSAFVCLVVLTAALSGCGGRRDDPREGVVVRERADGTRIAVRPGRDPNAAYIQATELKAKGDCATAITLLRPVAMLGPGYETAQTALGECLLLTDSEEDGVTWLTRAADAGWPEAQASLALHFARGDPAGNGEEAAYWLALYESNPSKARIGFRAPDATALRTALASLSETERTAGQRRAALWERKLWLPPVEADGTGLEPVQQERGFRRPPEQ